MHPTPLKPLKNQWKNTFFYFGKTCIVNWKLHTPFPKQSFYKGFRNFEVHFCAFCTSVSRKITLHFFECAAAPFFFLRPFSRGLVRPVITTLKPRAPAKVRPRQRSLPAPKHIPSTRECTQVTANYFLDSNQTPTGTPRQQRRTDQPGTSQDNTFEKCIIIFRDTDSI